MSHRLTDDELRAAAARRPGYATYPEYRQGQPERLGTLPAAAATHPRTRMASPPQVPADPAPCGRRSWSAATDCGPAPVTDVAVPLTLAELPPSRIFEFQPEHVKERPWWRRRWMWAVMPATGRTAWGYCWTSGGARRRTARAARRAAQ